jgi:hypothetical protein
MVPLTTVPNGFHARVLAARLGAAGVVTELKGGIDGPYPIGDVYVFVPFADLELARELLLVDEVEEVFAGPNPEPDLRAPPALWIVLVAILLMAAVLASRHSF